MLNATLYIRMRRLRGSRGAVPCWVQRCLLDRSPSEGHDPSITLRRQTPGFRVHFRSLRGCVLSLRSREQSSIVG